MVSENGTSLYVFAFNVWIAFTDPFCVYNAFTDMTVCTVARNEWVEILGTNVLQLETLTVSLFYGIKLSAFDGPSE